MRLKKNRFIKALKDTPNDGRVMEDLFAVLRKNLAMSTKNKPYLRLTLGDQSDTIDAFVWDDAEECGRRFREGDIVSVAFRLRTRNDVPQMHVEALDRLSEKDLEGLRWEDFRPGLDLGTRKQLWAGISEILEGVSHPPLRRLLDAFLADAGFRDAFLDAAAAKGFHHAYVGGLAEHTHSVLRLARSIGDLYAGRLNRDLLLAGAFLHDVGKVEELSPRTGDYTDDGRLLGHIVLGVQLLRRKAAEAEDVPASLLRQLEHLMLSHHGEKQWGSPVEPQTLEALTLHFLDNLDAKLAGATEWLDKEAVAEGGWSGFWRGLGRQIYRTPSLEIPTTGAEATDPFRDVEEEFLRRESAEEEERRREDRSSETGARKTPPGQGELGF